MANPRCPNCYSDRYNFETKQGDRYCTSCHRRFGRASEARMRHWMSKKDYQERFADKSNEELLAALHSLGMEDARLGDIPYFRELVSKPVGVAT